MRDVNKAIISGRLGRDAELRVTPGGTTVTSFAVASSRSQRVGDEWKEQTEWFRVITWNKLAEWCGDNLQKGTHVLVEGRIQTHDWQDADGNKRTATEIIASEVNLLGGGRPRPAADDIDAAFDNAAPAPAAAPQPRYGGQANAAPYRNAGDGLHRELADIPF